MPNPCGCLRVALIPEVPISVNGVVTRADHIRIAINEDASAAWRHRSHVKGEWLQLRPAPSRDDRAGGQGSCHIGECAMYLGYLAIR